MDVSVIYGFADAMSFVIRFVLNFLYTILPSNIAVMFAIAFTAIVALAIKRGVFT